MSRKKNRSATNGDDLDARNPRDEELSEQAETQWIGVAGMNERTLNKSLKKKKKKYAQIHALFQREGGI